MKIAIFGDSLTAGTPGASYFELLQRLLPEHELLNYGRGGDAVKDAYNLISALPPAQAYDLAFLWIGTNDVFMKVSPTFAMLRILRGQARVSDMEAFGRTYQATLEALRAKAKRVLTVSPWFVGEDVDNRWNRELDDLAAIVKDLSAPHDDIGYIDLRSLFKAKLAAKPTSDYVARGLLGIGRDLMALDDLEHVNRQASERGLYYTLDGTHLNGRGAHIIAGIFAAAINSA